jgi:subtilisin family serine protease
VACCNFDGEGLKGMNARYSGLILLCLLSLLCLPLTRAQSYDSQYIVVMRGEQSISVVNKAYGTRTLRKAAGAPVFLIGADGVSDDLLTKLKEDKNVDLAEKNGRVKMAAGDEQLPATAVAQQTASSLDAHTLVGFYGTMVLKSYADQPAVQITGANEARQWSTGAATRVATIDTGVDLTHPALSPWLDPGIDLLNNRSASELDGLPQLPAPLTQAMASLLDDRFSFILSQAMASLLDGDNVNNPFPPALGHGTLVAGLIHLIAPETRIVPIKAFDAYGNTRMFHIVEAVYRARELNVDVINMSFSLDEDSPVFKRAIVDAQASGIAVVASVGNSSSEVKRLYPAAYPLVIGVAATDFDDRLAGFSNFGKAVSVAAPGAFVVSTVPGGKYAAAWGTSFSAPIVSGAVALLASGGGHGQSDTALAVNMADSIDHLNPGFERKLGKGRINIMRSLSTR